MPLSHRSTSPGIFRLAPMHPAESLRGEKIGALVVGPAGIFVPASRLLRTNDPVPLCMKHALLATHPPATGLCLPVCRIRPTVADAARRNLCRVHRR
jgi:hypothetical protein